METCWMDGANTKSPVSSLAVLLSDPQGSSFFEPSPKGSLDVEESAGGAGDPQASSVFTGAAATQKCNVVFTVLSFLQHSNKESVN